MKLALPTLVMIAVVLGPAALQAGDTKGAVVLTAKDAGISGGAAYFADGDFVGALRDPKATLQWDLVVTKPATATVEVVQGCAPHGGGAYRLEIGPHALTGRARSTGDWNHYEPVGVGSVTLASGTHLVTLRADGPMKAAVMNLKAIRLSPLEGRASKHVPPPVPLPKQVFVIPNFHPASCGWLANFSDERNYCANNYLAHLDRVRDDRRYALAVSEVNNLIAIRNFAPDRFAEMKGFIAEGRVEPVNAFFLEPTVSLSGGEALAKMGIEGLRWQERMLGVRPRSCWAIDTCGIHDQMPQLCVQLGLDALVYNRAARCPESLFWSESPDGSRILTLSMGSYANNLAGLFSDARPPSDRTVRGVENAISTRRPPTPANAPVLILGGHGDYSPPPRWPENPSAFLDAWHAERPDCDLRFTGLSPYLGALLPLVAADKVELKSVRAGTGYAYGSFWINCPRAKTWFRRNEHALHTAEMLATIASVTTDHEYPVQPLHHAWLQMLLNMDRNSLWGSAAGMVFESDTSWDMKDRLAWVEDTCGRTATAAVRTLAGEGQGAVAFNPLAWKRRDVPELPPCGLGTLAAPGVAQTIPAPTTIDTPFYTATIDATTGDLVSVRCKPSGREMLGGPANVIVAEKQPKRQSCDNTPPRPKRTPWATSRDFPTTLTASEDARSITVEARGGFVGDARIVRTTRFSKSHERIDFETTLENVPEWTLVSAEFPLAAAPEEIRRGIPFGFSRDDGYVQGIAPAVRWSDYATPGRGGVAILDRGLPGREINGNVPVLFLLNAYDVYSGYPNAWTSGKGRHSLAYAILAHDADWPAARVPHHAWEFNCPPVTVPGCGRTSSPSFLTTSDNVLVEAMRRDGADIELRLTECLGVAGEAEVTLNLPHQRATLTDLVGRRGRPLDGGPTYRVPVKPQEIVTMRFTTAQPVAEVVPLTEWDALVPEAKLAALRRYRPELTGHPPHDVDHQTDQGNQATP